MHDTIVRNDRRRGRTERRSTTRGRSRGESHRIERERERGIKGKAENSHADSNELQSERELHSECIGGGVRGVMERDFACSNI